MARGEGSIVIARPPEAVFAFVGGAANNPRWRKNVIATVWLDDGPMRVGRVGRQTSRLLGRRMSVDARIVEWDPPRAAAWQAIAGGITVRTFLRVEPAPGGARMTMGAEGGLTGVIGRLLTPFAVRTMKRQAVADLQALRRILEADPA